MREEPSTQLALNPMVLTQPLPEGAVLMDAETGDCFELNRVGAEILEALRRGQTADEIADEVARRYTVDRAEVSSDVLALIETLARQGVLVSARR